MEKRTQGGDPPALLRCADIILPLLNPPDLAATSSTCKALHIISKRITAVRSSDAARSLEPHPVPFLNSVDSHPYAYFTYTPTQFLPGRAPDFGCWDERCTCRGEMAREGGLGVRVKVVRDKRKGWGLVAAQVIPCGKFVCEYAGELLTTEEARKRQRKYDQLTLGGRFASALLVVREHLPSGKACLRMNIDATVIGNVARFINHSCDGGNLSTELVRSSGAFLPRLCFFASRDIQEDEELSFSYGETRIRSNGLPCFCGSSSCVGKLPSENT